MPHLASRPWVTAACETLIQSYANIFAPTMRSQSCYIAHVQNFGFKINYSYGNTRNT